MASGIDRRSILKSIGASTATAGIFGNAVGAGAASPPSKGLEVPESDIEVINADLQSDGSVSASSATTRPELQNLVEYIENDTGLTAITESNLSIEVETNKEEFNGYDPVITVIPFGQERDYSSRDSQPGNGVLYVYTVAEDDERVPVGTFGLVSQPVSRQSASRRDHRRVEGASSGSNRFQITSYVLNDGEPVQAYSQIREVDGSNEVSGQASVVCYACQTLVDSVCVGGTRVLGTKGCMAACALAFGANFIAAFGCASVCSTMFTAIAAVGCTAGGSIICKEMTGIAPWGIKFC